MTWLQNEIANILNASAMVKKDLALGNTTEIGAAVRRIYKALLSGGKILLVGNGGSAAEAQHIAAEMVGRFRLERAALPAVSLCTDPSVVTALGNDFGYEHVFARQVEALARPGDVLVGITTSGGSPNVVRALEAAKAKSCFTIGLSGENTGPIKDLCDVLIAVPSNVTARIQEAHTTIGHIICELVEKLLVKGDAAGA